MTASLGDLRPGRVVDEVLAEAAAGPGTSPVSLLAPGAARAGVDRLRAELPGVRISYATKANALPRFLAVLADLVDEFNVTNVAHLDGLLGLGVDPARIQFLHPVVSARTVGAVLDRGISRFVVDDHRGLELLRAAPARSGRLGITVRVRPPSLGESPSSVVRFGREPDAVLGLARDVVRAGHEVEAVSFFVGTAKDPSGAPAHLGGIATVADVVETLEADGIPVGGINIGGGFPGCRRRFHREHPDYFARIAAALDARLGRDRTVTCEPGRYLAEPTLLLRTSVVADRSRYGRRLVHLDASGFGGLFETSFIDPGDPPAFLVTSDRPSDGYGPATVVGPVMDSFDVLARDVQLPRLAEGEQVLVPNVGAYTWGYTTRTEGVTAPPVVDLSEDLDRAVGRMWHP